MGYKTEDVYVTPVTYKEDNTIYDFDVHCVKNIDEAKRVTYVYRFKYNDKMIGSRRVPRFIAEDNIEELFQLYMVTIDDVKKAYKKKGKAKSIKPITRKRSSAGSRRGTSKSKANPGLNAQSIKIVLDKDWFTETAKVIESLPPDAICKLIGHNFIPINGYFTEEDVGDKTDKFINGRCVCARCGTEAVLSFKINTDTNA